MELLFGMVIFLGLMFLGLPLIWSILAGTLVIVFVIGKSYGYAMPAIFNGLQVYTLLAVPLFIMAGDLMGEGGISKRLVALAYVLVRRLKGGMGAVPVVGSLLFGTVTGSVMATVATIGSITIPALEKYGYDRRYTTAIVAASGFLGYMIPPSILAIIFSYLANISVAALFLATVVPGIMVGAAYMVINYFMCNKWMHPVKSPELAVGKQVGMIKELGQAIWHALPGLFASVTILGVIYGGIATPTEAAAVAVVYALIVGFFVHRELTLKSFWQVAKKSAISTVVVFAIIMVAMPFTQQLIMRGLPETLAKFVTGFSSNVNVIWLMYNILMLILGMFLSELAILMIIVPLLLPLMTVAGVNLIHLGVVHLLNSGIGTFTPPFAAALFLAARVGKVDYVDTIKPLSPFIFFGAIPVLFITTYFPQLSLWLPTLILGEKAVYGM